MVEMTFDIIFLLSFFHVVTQSQTELKQSSRSTIFKIFIEFVSTLFPFYVLVSWPQGMWDPRFPSRDGTSTPYTGRQCPNHWAPRSVHLCRYFTMRMYSYLPCENHASHLCLSSYPGKAHAQWHQYHVSKSWWCLPGQARCADPDWWKIHTRLSLNVKVLIQCGSGLYHSPRKEELREYEGDSNWNRHRPNTQHQSKHNEKWSEKEEFFFPFLSFFPQYKSRRKPLAQQKLFTFSSAKPNNKSNVREIVQMSQNLITWKSAQGPEL